MHSVGWGSPPLWLNYESKGKFSDGCIAIHMDISAACSVVAHQLQKSKNYPDMWLIKYGCNVKVKNDSRHISAWVFSKDLIHIWWWEKVSASTLQLTGEQSCSIASCLTEQSCSSYKVIKKHHQEWFHCEPYTLPDPDAARAAVVAVTRCTGIARPGSLSLAASSLALVSWATVHSWPQDWRGIREKELNSVWFIFPGAETR